MKFKFLLLLTILFCSAHSFAQVPKAKTNYHPQVLVKKMPPKTELTKNTPPPAPTDLQKAVINIVVGDDGKDKDTYFAIIVNDGNKRIACYYGNMWKNGVIHAAGGGEYFTGDNETLPLTLDASVPTGEMRTIANIPIPITKEAALADFTNNNGGSLELDIYPNGHDTWKISSLSLTLYFNNDASSPRKITWHGITVSQDSRIKVLEFDKDFNPIQ